MNHAFDNAVRQVIAREGGSKLTNDPNDRGGLTKYGISKRAYPDLDIQNLTETQAIGIYKRDYWDALKLDDVRDPLIAAAIFDTAVNMGATTAARLAQSLAGAPVDGKIGPVSIAGINRSEPMIFLPMFVIARIERYSDICSRDPSQKKFLHGWIRRALELLG